MIGDPHRAIEMRGLIIEWGCIASNVDFNYEPARVIAPNLNTSHGAADPTFWDFDQPAIQRPTMQWNLNFVLEAGGTAGLESENSRDDRPLFGSI